MYVHLDLEQLLMEGHREGLDLDLPFRPISQGKNKLQQDESQVKIFEDYVDFWGDIVTERERSSAISRRRPSPNKIHDNASGEPK
jgi:hypothetical protein